MREERRHGAAMRVRHDNRGVEADPRAGGDQAAMKHLIFLRKVTTRKAAGPVEGVAAIGRIPLREIGRIPRSSKWQEFPELAKVSRPARRGRPFDVADRAADGI